MMTLWERYCAAERSVAETAVACGRKREEVLLLAVSKTVSAERIAELYAHGVRCFGENRAAVLAEKAKQLPADIEWHYIGPLQSNKVRKVVQAASVIHSVDNAELLARLDRIAGEEGRTVRFLIEVSVSGEASKGGVPIEDLDELAMRANSCVNAVWSGLMTMAPLAASSAELHDIFGRLAAERTRLERHFSKKLPLLSMGMSGDFREAIACGSTIVRLGTCIFSDKED
jgi:hypothetical protein